MTDQELLDILADIFRDAFHNDEIVLTPESKGPDIPGWDSFHYVDIILRIEERLNINIRVREANTARNMADLLRLIRSKLG